MKKMILTIAMYLISYASNANFSCNDREYLKNILVELNQACNSEHVCSANGYKGSTIEIAVSACSKIFTEIECLRAVTCSEGAPVCNTVGFKGSTIENAISSCRKVYTLAECSRGIECNSVVRVCNAKGFKAPTAEKAVIFCSKTYPESECQKVVNCK